MPRHFLNRLSMAIVFCGSLFASASCGRLSPPGEVILLITTDLAVPADGDTLHITVTRSGGNKPFLDKRYRLWAAPAGGDPTPTAGTVSLPGTYALESSDEVSGRLAVHVELIQGGDSGTGTVRVQRDADLDMPSEGVKQLAMPLEFLCGAGNLPDPCPSGTTCEAGSCVDDKLSLADYVGAAPSDCFDVPTCFQGASTNAPQPDPTFGCSIKIALRGANINVALIVDASKVGNYGVCGPLSGKCLVPLDQGPGGWQTLVDSTGQLIAIGLPEAVCTAFQHASSIEGIAVTDSACAPKSASAGLCSAAGGCFAASGICPATWQGYSCSGTALPPVDVTPAPFCEQARTDPTLGSVAPGLWCCGGVYTPPTTSLLIDDMSTGPQIKIAAQDGVPAGLWWSQADGASAVISPPPYPALFTQRVFDPPATPLGGPTISHAACLRSDGLNGDWAAEGFTFRQTAPAYSVLPFDVRPHTGIRFWATAAPSKILGLPTTVRVSFPDANTDLLHADSTCVMDGRRCDNFGEEVTLPDMPDWQLYTLKWSNLRQSANDYGQELFSALDEQHVYQTQFEIDGPTLPFDFCVAEIEFTDD